MIEKNWRDLIKPKALDVDKESLSTNYGKFVAKPLERGYGLTLGNSLRRVLLSSLQGAAITAVKIDGVARWHRSTPEAQGQHRRERRRNHEMPPRQLHQGGRLARSGAS